MSTFISDCLVESAREVEFDEQTAELTPPDDHQSQDQLSIPQNSVVLVAEYVESKGQWLVSNSPEF